MKLPIAFAAATVALMVVLLVAAPVIAIGTASHPAPQTPLLRGAACHVVAPGQGDVPASFRLDPAQVANTRIIVGVAEGLDLPARAAVVALAAARQESGLHNLPYGDRDSLGLFQMRPSMGWGSPAQILDPVYAATTFYRHLTAVAGWMDMPITVAAQAVERSAYPDAYAQWAPLATALTEAFLRHGADIVTC